MLNEENTSSTVNHLHHQPILPPPSQGTRKSNRVPLPTDAFLQSLSQEHLAFSAFLTQEHAMDYHIQKTMSDPIAFYQLLTQTLCTIMKQWQPLTRIILSMPSSPK